jgi:outer membrane protein assembly factor BamB
MKPESEKTQGRKQFMKTPDGRVFVLSALLALGGGAALDAASSVGWRGDGTGSYPSAKPPTVWSSTSNVIWNTRLAKFSNASPLILGDRLFICSEPATLVCVALADGKILWEKENAYVDILPPDQVEKVRQDRAAAVALQGRINPLKKESKKLDDQVRKEPENAEAKARLEKVKKDLGELEGQLGPLNAFADPATHDVNGYSSPTPATDGKRVYVLFGTGVAACYEPDGKRVWARLIEKPSHSWGGSASPLVIGSKMLCHILKLTALDTATGDVLWSTPSRPVWGSPVGTRIGDTEVAITAGGDIIRAADGKLLAQKVSGLDYCAPLVERGLVYFVQNGGKAIRLPATAEEPFKTEVVWETSPKKERYYASPVHLDGLLYGVTQHGDYSVIDALDGRVVLEKKLDLGGTFYPSITLAGGLLYVSGDSGKTVVLQPGRDYKELARNVLEPFRSNPVFAGERLYVRTLKGLYCIGR